MELCFFGTSSGVPTTTRNVSATAIGLRNSKHWCLVDCGEGTQHQILRTHFSLNRLQAIFITHVHGDHCYGLPGLLASAGLAGRTNPLCIVGVAEIKQYLDAVREMTQMGLPYLLQFVDIENIAKLKQSCEIDFEIEAIRLSHRVPSFAYGFIERTTPTLDTDKLDQAGIPRGPLWGDLQHGKNVVTEDGETHAAHDYFLPPRKPRKIIIAGDNDTPALLSDAAKSAEVLVHEATYTEDILNNVGEDRQHCSAKRLAQFAAEVELKNLVMTHFSPRYHDDPDSPQSIKILEEEARQQFQQQLFLAKDFDRFYLNKQGELRKI